MTNGTYYWNFFLEEWNYKGGSEYYNNIHYGHAKFSLGGEFNAITDGTTYGYKVYGNKFYNSDYGLRNVNGNEETIYAIVVEGDQHREVYVYNNYIEKYAIGIAISTPSSGTGYWHHNWEWDGIYIYYNRIKDVCYKDFQYGAMGIWWINETDDPEFTGTYENIGIYNNTITGGNSGIYEGYHGIGVYANQNVNNVNIKNNIIYNFQWSGISITEHVNDSLSLTNLAVTYNNIYGCGNSNDVLLEAAGGGRIYNLIDITTGNIKTNPLFKSNETFRLRPGSPAIDTGVDVGLTHDYWGHRVPQNSTPDIGACEYGNYVLFYNGKQLY